MLKNLFFKICAKQISILLGTHPMINRAYKVKVIRRGKGISRFQLLNLYNSEYALAWCNAVRPSTLAVFISAPIFNNLCTSSLSPAVEAAKNTTPGENWILDARLGIVDCLLVSDSSHLFNCSALLNKADDDLRSVILTFINAYTLHSIWS